MSKNAKIVVWVIVAIIVVGGIWWYVANQGGNNQYGMSNTTSTGTAVAPAPSGAATSSNDASDQSISQDMTNINAQMNGLSSDSASVDQSMSDQQGPQQQF